MVKLHSIALMNISTVGWVRHWFTFIKGGILRLFIVLSLFAPFSVVHAASVTCNATTPPSYGAALPLYQGMGVVSHAPNLYSNSNYTVLTVLDIRDPANASTESPSIAALGQDWLPPSTTRYSHPSWTQDNLGDAFGLALEEEVASPDIFLVSKGEYGPLSLLPYRPKPRVGGNGSEVFRIDGVSGDITVMKTLPGVTWATDTKTTMYTGLGQIAYNEDAKVVYVTNISNGLIYTLDASGASNAVDVAEVGTPYDHGLTLTPPIPDSGSYYTPYSRMVMAVAYNSAERRLYYSVPITSTSTITSNKGIGNEVWSLPLNVDGSIDATASPLFEFRLNVTASTAYTVVSDMVFSNAGDQLYVAENSLQYNFGSLPSSTSAVRVAHTSSGYQFSGQSGSWVNLGRRGPTAGRGDLRGGVDFGFNNWGVNSATTNFEDSIVFTGDLMKGSPFSYGLNLAEPGKAFVANQTYFVQASINGSERSNTTEEKYLYGDVEIFGCAPPPPMVSLGDVVWLEDDNDGDATTGTITYPPAGTVVTATASDGITQYTGATDATGHYLISVPQNDTYTVSVDTPLGYVPSGGSADASVPDATTENNKNHNGNGTTVVITTSDNLTLDFGFSLPAPKVDIHLDKAVDKSITRRGEQVVYTLTVTNESANAATGVQVSDLLSAGVRYISDDGVVSYGTDVYDENTGVWVVGDMPAGASKELRVTVQVE